MRYLENFGDQRQTAFCAHCGSINTETFDHIPSKVLLDEPYPDQLPGVSSCRECNEGFSKDELYLACLVECVLRGSTRPEDLQRAKIARALRKRPELAARLARTRHDTDAGIIFSAETEKVRRVLLKLARGHALFELNEPHPEAPSSMLFAPVTALSQAERERFESPPGFGEAAVWPEVGSRAMQRLVESWPGGMEWIIIQPGRYRYLASAGGDVVIRMVLSEYLACEVVWG